MTEYTEKPSITVQVNKCEFHFKQRVSVLKEPAGYSVTSLMVSHCLLLLWLQHLRLLLKT